MSRGCNRRTIAAVLILFHQAALGDLTLTLPLVRRLLPISGGRVTIVAPFGRALLAARLLGDAAQPAGIEMFEFTRLHTPGGPSALSPAVDELFADATRIVSFVSAADDPWAHNVRRLAPQAHLHCLEPRPPADWDQHVTRWHADQLGELDPPPPPPNRPAVATDPAGPWVVHPGSGGIDKCWPPERHESLIEKLRDRGEPVRVLLGEAEVHRWPPPQVQRWRDELDATPCWDPVELLEQLAGARGYIGNDAGPTHVAAAAGLPTWAIFGPTNPAVWSPVGPDVHIVRATHAPWPTVDDVLAAIRTSAGLEQDADASF